MLYGNWGYKKLVIGLNWSFDAYYLGLTGNSAGRSKQIETNDERVRQF